jgi:hypothetical protein
MKNTKIKVFCFNKSETNYAEFSNLIPIYLSEYVEEFKNIFGFENITSNKVLLNIDLLSIKNISYENYTEMFCFNPNNFLQIRLLRELFDFSRHISSIQIKKNSIAITKTSKENYIYKKKEYIPLNLNENKDCRVRYWFSKGYVDGSFYYEQVNKVNINLGIYLKEFEELFGFKDISTSNIILDIENNTIEPNTFIEYLKKDGTPEIEFNPHIIFIVGILKELISSDKIKAVDIYSDKIKIEKHSNTNICNYY